MKKSILLALCASLAFASTSSLAVTKHCKRMQKAGSCSKHCSCLLGASCNNGKCEAKGAPQEATKDVVDRTKGN